MAFLFYSLDWNINFLLIGDQFANALAQFFFLLLHAELIKKNKQIWRIFLWTFLAAASHNIYGPLAIFSISIFLIIEKLDNKYFTRLTYLTPVILFIFTKVLKYFLAKFQHIDIIHYIYSKLTWPIHKGPLEGFFLRPGVLLASSMHFFTLFRIYKLKTEIFKSKKKMFIFIHFFTFWLFSKYGVIFNENLVEPNRVYFVLSPFLSLLLAICIRDFSKRTQALFVVGYFLINFSMRNFSHDAILSFRSIAHQDLGAIYNWSMAKSSCLGLSVFILIIFASLIYLFPKKNDQLYHF